MTRLRIIAIIFIILLRFSFKSFRKYCIIKYVMSITNYLNKYAKIKLKVIINWILTRVSLSFSLAWRHLESKRKLLTCVLDLFSPYITISRCSIILQPSYVSLTLITWGYPLKIIVSKTDVTLDTSNGGISEFEQKGRKCIYVANELKLVRG